MVFYDISSSLWFCFYMTMTVLTLLWRDPTRGKYFSLLLWSIRYAKQVNNCQEHVLSGYPHCSGFSEISFLIDVEPANNWSLSFSCHIVVLSNSPTHMYSQYHGSIHSFMRNILLHKTVINIIILISVISVTCKYHHIQNPEEKIKVQSLKK